MCSLAIVTAHAGASTLQGCSASWSHEPTYVMDGENGMLQAYDKGWREHPEDIIAYLHDDVRIDEDDWQDRVLVEFQDPSVGLVGFGGAIQHGSPDLYKIPYEYRQLGRSGYLSNVEDAEVHGTRFDGSTDVAVLDGFALIVRRKILEACGGWPLSTPIGYSLYDYFLCCETHRQGYRIHMVGIKCHHYGGQTAVILKKADGQGKAHEDAHRWMYDNYKDVLPFRCS